MILTVEDVARSDWIQLVKLNTNYAWLITHPLTVVLLIWKDDRTAEEETGKDDDGKVMTM